MRSVCVAVSSVLLSFSLFAADIPRAARFERVAHEHGAFVIRSVDGKTSCNDATRTEAMRINAPKLVPTRVFGENTGRVRTNGGSAGLNIILRGTAQLDANPAAKAAFERAAEIWESRIADEISVFVDVDFGSTRFGDPFDENVIASASSNVLYADSGIYGDIRALLVSRGHNATESSVYNALPATSMPTDAGSTTGSSAPSMLLRAIGAIDPVAPPDDENGAPNIGFNSAFPYDFDPTNGITPGQTDFEGVVVHEIGHMLGFVSNVGGAELGGDLPIGIFDYFRFRPGVNIGNFGTAQRVQASGGSQVYFTGTGTLALSTGRPDGTGGDEQQASHWKDDAITGNRIGVMDPTLSKGVRSQLTNADLQAFDMMGYEIVTPGGPQAPAAPTNLVAAGTNTTTIRLTWTDNSNNETGFVVEQKVGPNFVPLNPVLAANTTTVDVGGFTAATTATFRVKATGAGGDSGYSNEATGTTTQPPGVCTSSDTVVCLLNNRFSVKIDYVNPFSNPPNQPGTFRAARLLSGAQNPDTALFGFSSAQAVEVVVRLQDTRPFAPRFDVYYGGMTDVGYTVTVTDTQTGVTKQYNNQVGKVGGGVDRTTFPASALGSPDRMITSGGHDSFPAEMESVQPGDLVGINPLRLSQGRKPARLSMAPAPVAEPQAGLVPNAGGGGACAESEPNNTVLHANTMSGLEPCTGSAAFGDAFTYEIEYEDETVGRVHDVFRLVRGSAGPLTVNLTFATPSANLDVILFTSDLDIVDGAANLTGTTEQFTVPSLPAGTYYIGVSAYSGGSSYTLTAGGIGPAAPSNLVANGTSTSVIRLQWVDNANNETGYVVEQKVGPNFVTLNPVLAANTTAVNVTGFAAATTATFRVKATNGGGDSGYSNEATGTTHSQGGGGCTPNDTTVCLLSDRFRVSITYVNPFSNPPNQPGTFRAARLLSGVQNPDTGLFGFSSAQAVEVVVRVQDTRPFANRFDVYYGGMTDVGYIVTVTDTQTGTTRQYSNTVGTVGGGVDRNSFPAN